MAKQLKGDAEQCQNPSWNVCVQRNADQRDRVAEHQNTGTRSDHIVTPMGSASSTAVRPSSPLPEADAAPENGPHTETPFQGRRCLSLASVSFRLAS